MVSILVMRFSWKKVNFADLADVQNFHVYITGLIFPAYISSFYY